MLHTVSLAVELDLTTTPPAVSGVYVLILDGSPAYSWRAHDKKSLAVLTEVSARSVHEAIKGLAGIVERDKELAWVRDYPHVRNTLGPDEYRDYTGQCTRW